MATTRTRPSKSLRPGRVWAGRGASDARRRTHADGFRALAQDKAEYGLKEARAGRCMSAVYAYGETMATAGRANTMAEHERERGTARIYERMRGTITQLERTIQEKCFASRGLSALHRRKGRK